MNSPINIMGDPMRTMGHYTHGSHQQHHCEPQCQPICPSLCPPSPCPPPPEPYAYVVVKGDSVYFIAQRFGTSMQAIILANNLTNPDLIFPGQILLIPGV